MLSTAVADVINPDGTRERLVGSSRRTLNAAQRAALRPGEIPIAGSGHAEITVLNAARMKGQAVQAIASSRPACLRCREAIEAAGAKVIEQRKDGSQ
jgi:hypothetical protein